MSLPSEDQSVRLLLNWAREEPPSPISPPLDLPQLFFAEPQDADSGLKLDVKTEELSHLLFKSMEEFVSNYFSVNSVDTAVHSNAVLESRRPEIGKHQRLCPSVAQKEQQSDHNTSNGVDMHCESVTVPSDPSHHSSQQHATESSRVAYLERLLLQQQEAIQQLQQSLQTHSSFSPHSFVAMSSSTAPSTPTPPLSSVLTPVPSTMSTPASTPLSTSPLRSVSAAVSSHLSSSTALSVRHNTKAHRVRLALAKCLQRVDAPRFSSLSFAEHTQFLRLQRLLSLSAEQYTTHPAFSHWKSLVDRVHHEQELFRQHEFCVAHMSPQRERFLIYPTAVRTLVEKVLDIRKQRVYRYPRFYRQVYSESLELNKAVGSSSGSESTLQHIRTLLKQGKCHLFDCSALPSGMRIPMQINYYPSAHEDGAGRWWSKRPAPVVSEDPIIEHLVHSEPIDVVFSSSSLTALFCLPLLNEASCEMPVTVRSVGGRSVLYIDPPFVKQTYTAREKNTIFYSLAIKHLGFNAPTVECAKTFTAAVHSDTPARGEVPFPCPGPDNLIYNLWQFGSWRILLRCCLHGMIPDSREVWKYVNITSKLEYWEESVESGGSRAEMFTLEERARQWIKGFIRPGPAGTLFAHIDPITQTLRRFTFIENQSLLPSTADNESKELSFSRTLAFKILCLVLERLRNLSAGYTYIISYHSKTRTLRIYQSIKEEVKTEPEIEAQYPSKEEKSEDDLRLTNTESASSTLSPIGPKILTQCSGQPLASETKTHKSYDLDLYQVYATAGITDIRTVHYIPLRWPNNRANQVPYTFSPLPEVDENTGQLKYCHSFAERATCNPGSECPFPHLTHLEVMFCQQATAKEQQRKKRKLKSKRKKVKSSRFSENSITKEQ
jgi:hypothetical protein